MTSESERRLSAAVVTLTHATKPALRAVYGADEQEGKVFGSGTVVALGGSTFLLTADHVVDEARKYYPYVAWAPVDFDVVHLTEWTCREGPPRDFALAKVRDDLRAIRPDAFGDSTVDYPLYFMHGFPGADSRFSVLAGGIVSDSRPYMTVGGTLPSGARFNGSMHFAIDYPAPEHQQVSVEGKAVSLPNPRGYSGSAVWGVEVDKNGAPQTDSARIVGLATNYDEASQQVIVVRIETVTAIILQRLRQQRAYEHWEKRGAGVHDDWADWFAAAAELPRL